MFPFWEVAVAPVLEAAGAHRLVEIGALRGENTRLIIDRLGPQTELHVVDPLPDFDPAVHEQEFAGQYVFHRDLSVNVLGQLPPMDAALIDGDHNWFTVYNELRLLREVARSHDAPLPVMILHDVGWPYGRRDLYYDPSNIPDDYRRDWKRAGMEPGKVRLVPFGAGLNPTLANAKVEGGRRNGVMTGLDDFVAEHDRPMRVVVLPIYFGLAIAVETERLDRQPALAAELDRLESPAGKDALLELAEDIRLQALIFQHKIFYDREKSIARLARRYLGQMKDGPVGEAAGRDSLDEIESCLDGVRADYVLGDLVACGVGNSEPVAFLGAYLEAYDLTGRHLWAIEEDEGGEGVSIVRSHLQQLDLVTDRFHQVFAPADVDIAHLELPEQIALLHVGPALAAASPVLLDALYQRVAHGGYVLADQDAGPDVAAALEALRTRAGVASGAVRLGPNSLGWHKADAGGADDRRRLLDPALADVADHAHGF